MSDLPKGWVWTTLGEHSAASRRGLNPKNYADEMFDLLSIPAYDEGSPEVIDGSRIGSTKNTVAPGDVMISKIVPHIRRVWVVPARNGRRQISSGEWITFRSPAFLPSFLRHYLLSDTFHREFMNTVAGVGGSLLRARPQEVGRIRIPLPPLEEQRCIAAILDFAMGIRDTASRYNQTLRAHRRAAFLDTLSGYPASQVPLKALSSAVIDCPHSTPRWQESGVTCLRTTNLGHGDWNWDDHRFVDEAQHKERSKRAELLPGDIILSREGTVGVMAMVPPGMKASLGQRLVQVRPLEGVNGEYLMEALMHELSPTRIEHRMIGATAKRINVKALRELMLPVPSRAAQEDFAAVATRTRQIQEQAETRLATITTLTRSLQSRAFRGEL